MRIHSPPLLCSLAAFAPLAVAAPAGPSDPKVVIAEIAADPLGPDAGQEWIELAVTGSAVPFSLAGYRLESVRGGFSYTFGNSSVVGGDTVLVAIGPIRPSLAALDLSAGAARILFSGPVTTGRLDNQSEALVLRRPDGSIHDFVAFGATGEVLNTAPFAEAVSAAQWPAGQWVRTGFGAPTAMQLGGTLGRDYFANDTNAVSDWAGNGGPFGVGASPGGPNSVDVVNAESLLLLAQDGFNAALSAYTYHPSEALRFSVTDGKVDDLVVVDQLGFHWSCTATHSFTVNDTQSGLGPVTWSGKLQHEFHQTGLRAYRLQVYGQLTSEAGDGLDLDLRLDRDGYGSAAVREMQTAKLLLHLSGSSHPFESTNITTTTRTGANSFVLRTERQETSWASSQPLVLVGEATVVQQSDGLRSFDFAIDGTPFGQGLAPIGAQTNVSTAKMNFSGSGACVLSGPESFVTTLSHSNMSVDGVLRVRTTSKNPVTFRSTRQDGVPGDVTGTLLTESLFPLLGPTGDQVLVSYGHLDKSVFQQDQGKYTVASTVSFLLNGTVTAQGSCFSDPPLQTYHPPADVVSTTTLYGDNSGDGWGVVGSVVKVAGGMAIKAVCVKACVAALVAGGAAAPASGGSSILGGIALTWKASLACAAAGTAWELLF
jgi:hypothetical protein